MDTSHLFTTLLQLILRGAVLLALAGLAALLMRRASAAHRHLVWALAVAGVLLLPVLTAVLPAWWVRVPAVQLFAPRSAAVSPTPAEALGTTIPVDIPGTLPPAAMTPPPAPAITADVPVAPLVPNRITETQTARPAPALAGTPIPALPRVNWPAMALAVWLLGALLLLARGGVGVLRTRRDVRAASSVEEDWHILAAEIAAVLRLRRPVRLLISGRAAVPIICGIFRPCLLLPAESVSWPEERRRVILLHELAHVRRGDCLTQWLAALVCALHWPNPLVWLAAHRLRVEREAACDDLVLSIGVKPSDYAAHLLDIARALQGTRPAPLAGIAMLRSSRIGRRIAALLDSRRNRCATSWWALLLILLVAVPLLVALAIAQENTGNQQSATPTYTPIPLPASVPPDQVVVSPDGRHVAYVDTENGGQVIVLDGERRLPVEQIRAPWFTLGTVHGESLPGIFFSPDGEHMAYAVKEGAGWTIVFDGEKGQVYDDLDIPVYSPDSRKAAFVARRGDGYLVDNGREGKVYDSIGSGGGYAHEPSTVRPRFTADSRRLVYLASKLTDRSRGTREHYLVSDGHEMPLDGWLTGLTFPEQGPRMAYIVLGPGGRIAVIDGNEHPEYGSAEEIAFSSDGRRVAVVTSTEGKSPYRLWIDGKVHASAEKIYNPGFSPDGTRIFYIVQKGQGDSGLVVDDDFYSFGLPPVFSPDSRHVAVEQQLWAMEKRSTKTVDWKVCVLRDGQPGPTVEHVEDIHFSPDSRHLVYRATVEKKPVLVIDDRIHPIEGQLVGAHEPRAGGGPWNTRSIFFDAPDRFHYFAVKDSAIHRVEETIPQSRQLTKMQKDSSPLWSPDGKMIAFSSTRQYHLDLQMRTDELWVMRADGMGQRVLLPHTHPALKTYDSCVREKTWFPDSGSLLCKMQHTKKLLLRVYLNGNVDVLYEDQAISPFSPRLSPDGRWVAYYTHEDDTGGKLVLLDVRTKKRRMLTAAGRIIDGLTWTADNRYIVYARRKAAAKADLWRIAIAGGEPVNLSNTPAIDERDPICAPDGQTLLFIADSRAYLTALETCAPRMIYASDEKGTSVQAGEGWSPDSRFLRLRLRHERPSGTSYRLIERNGKEIPIPADMTFDSFAPDSRTFAGTRNRDIWVETIPANGLEAPPKTASAQTPQPGVSYRNLLLSVECEQSYAAGKPVTFTVHEKNVGKEEIRLGFYRFPTYYKLFIQDAAGRPVEKSASTRQAEDEYEHPVPISRPENVIRLQPGEELKRAYDLCAYVIALPPGSYSLQVMRRGGFLDAGERTRGGGALSLPCRFVIE